MHAEYLVINECCNWHAVKYVLEFLPYADTVPPFAFVVESIDPVNLSAFMVSAEKEKVLFKLYLVCEK